MTQHGRPRLRVRPVPDRGRERLLRRGGTVVPLPPKAVALLMALLHRSGEFIEKGQLLAEVWPDTFVEEGSLTQTVSARKALGEAPASLHRDDRGAVIDSSRRSRLCAVGGTLPVTCRAAPGEPVWRPSAGVLR